MHQLWNSGLGKTASLLEAMGVPLRPGLLPILCPGSSEDWEVRPARLGPLLGGGAAAHWAHGHLSGVGWHRIQNVERSGGSGCRTIAARSVPSWSIVTETKKQVQRLKAAQ